MAPRGTRRHGEAGAQLMLFAELPSSMPEAAYSPDEDDGLFAEILEDLACEPPDEEALSRTRRLQDLVSSGAGGHVRLVITDNRHSLLSWRWEDADGDDGQYVIRAHHMFLDAPDDVAEAVGRWMAQPRRSAAGSVIDRFMSEHRHLITRDRRPLAPPQGAHHNLQDLFDELNAGEFQGAVQASIGWGEPGTPRRRRRTTIQLGCYDPESTTIIIHPALDQRFVPRFFVTSVVFHEMLHQQVPATAEGDRRSVHTPQFKAREDAFHLTAPALEWQRDNLKRLLSYQRPRPVAERSRTVSTRACGKRA